ncbi:hypothetical protein GM658_26670 [Pseudoduganella eburnea]|uniref:Transmembrane protein n=1 Tax=Massilia eburnea TaxID=1776165 RepID=A0A6L6QRV8_9BURK|nr:DUF6622 family protein [Massilia eburnea]MTW14203.1 hypothetical protein [Massilia eburnea]
MLQQIVSHTPAYVWAILGFLVYRGVAASRDRILPVRQVFILPLVMLALGLQSTVNGFGLASPAGAAWLLGLAAGVAMMWKGAGQGAVLDRAAGTVQLRGSWLPMALMMTIFVGKFAMAVALAAQPGLRASLAFALPACALFGAFSGAFMARPLRVAASLRAATGSATAPL